jgi:hypothetical protein
MMAAEELHELIRCALNKTMRVYPASLHRELVLLGLIQAGYMIPIVRIGDRNFHPDSVGTLPEHDPITFTNRGRDYVLTLNPVDFEDVKSWPLADDIRLAQTLIKNINFC